MNLFLQTAVNGLAISLIYVFIGTSVTIISGVSRLTDFSQASVLVLASFVCFAAGEAGAPLPVIILVGPLTGAIWGFAVHRILLGRLTADPLPMFIVTIGISIALQSAIVKVWGPDQRRISVEFLRDTVAIGDLRVPATSLLFLVVCGPTLAALYYLLQRTQTGRRMRAAAENRDAATLVGVDVPRTALLAYVMGCALSGTVGALAGLAYPFTPFSGSNFLLKAFAVALVGGLGSVGGAAVVGVILGLVETYAVTYGVDLGFVTLDAGWRDGYAFVLMIAILVVKPSGLFRGTGELAR
jgi:branched-chain amino acid transport system permease protein